MNLSAKELSGYLNSVYNNAAKIDKLKIIYRPYICPFDVLINECAGSKTIMDIGCGSGQFLLLLSKYTNAAKLGGIEISSTLVNNARQLLSSQRKTNFQVEVYDGTHIPDFICEFDTLVLIDVFHHIPEKEQLNFIAALYSKMKPGSKLIFKDINAAHPFVLMNKIHDTLLGGGAGKEISISAAEQMLQQAGFKILSVSKKTMIWYPHYTIVCAK